MTEEMKSKHAIKLTRHENFKGLTVLITDDGGETWTVPTVPVTIHGVVFPLCGNETVCSRSWQNEEILNMDFSKTEARVAAHINDLDHPKLNLKSTLTGRFTSSTPNYVELSGGKTPYPDRELINRLRAKFLTYTVYRMTSPELVDLINHQNELIRDLENANTSDGGKVDFSKTSERCVPRYPKVRNKVGFVGFCMDFNHPFDTSCKEGDHTCVGWKNCYDKFAGDPDAYCD